MADTRNSGRIKKYGVCLNDKCEKYKQVQEVVHGEMICPSCKKKLSPCAPPESKKNKKPLIIGGAVVGVAARGLRGPGVVTVGRGPGFGENGWNNINGKP